jgi:hypothetical protein
MRKLLLGALGAALAIVPVANASLQFDYLSDFETFNGNAAGVNINSPSQEGWFQPVLGGTDFFCYTYAGNAPGFNSNPTGDNKFVGGRGPGGTVFARTQRVIPELGGTGTGQDQTCMCYDFAVLYGGPTPESAQNIGSVSTRDAAAAIDVIHLLTWVDPLTPTSYNAFYLVYDAAGIQTAQPGLSPGPAWEGLAVNHWYRACITFDLATNTFLDVSIDDLEDGADPVVVDVSAMGWYMDGGSAGPFTLPSQLRFFAGGSVDGNVCGFDNLAITYGVCNPPVPVENTTWGGIKDKFGR